MTEHQPGVPYHPGDRVRVQVKKTSYKSSRASALAGFTGTVVDLGVVLNKRVSEGQFVRWVGVEMDDTKAIPAQWVTQHIYQSLWVEDVEPIEDELTDEKILALFQVTPHEHVCRECGMTITKED